MRMMVSVLFLYCFNNALAFHNIILQNSRPIHFTRGNNNPEHKLITMKILHQYVKEPHENAEAEKHTKIGEIEYTEKYNLNWFVIDKTSDIKDDVFYKGIINDKPFLLFKNNSYYYTSFVSYRVIEKNGLTYINTMSSPIFKPKYIDIYEEPEFNNTNFTGKHFNMTVNMSMLNINKRLLDLLNIVKDGQNIKPFQVSPPIMMSNNTFHYKNNYMVLTDGDDKIINKIKITNEFIFPSTIIFRIKKNENQITLIIYTTPTTKHTTDLHIQIYQNNLENNLYTPIIHFYKKKKDQFFQESLITNILKIIKDISEKPEPLGEEYRESSYTDLKDIYQEIYKKYYL